MKSICPVCAASQSRSLVVIDELPVFCNVQHRTADEALAEPTGRLDLHYCEQCQHFFNAAFDASLLSYGAAYENSLHFSPTFSGFARDLARQLVDRFDVHRTKIVDIGCGKGDFLRLLCKLGDNEGFGFDPSYDAERDPLASDERVHFYREPFGPEYGDIDPGLVTCCQVLEHIEQPVGFLTEIVKSLACAANPGFYLEVPNALYTVRDLGIWDLIYEHSQYFSPVSFCRLAAMSGLQPERIRESFGAQYLSLEASRADGKSSVAVPPDPNIDSVAEHFPVRFEELLQRWKHELMTLTDSGPALIWGAGSKGVTFANLVGSTDRIAGLVDINPHKRGLHIAGTGHRIIGPDMVQQLEPAVILVMNPLYEAEIIKQVRDLGCPAAVRVVD